MMDITISTDMRIYDHVLLVSADTLSLMKKADQLVLKYQAKMQTAEANLKSAHDLLTPREWKTMISSWEVTPARLPSPAKEEEESVRSRDKTPSSKTKSVAFASVRPTSPTPPIITAPTVSHPILPSWLEGASHRVPRRTAPVATGSSPRMTGNGTAPQTCRNSADSRILSTIKCYNCGTLGHYATDCPEPRKPLSDTPVVKWYDPAKTPHPAQGQLLSHGQALGGQRTANVPQLNTGATQPQVSFVGESYWAGCSAIRVTQDYPWTRFDRAYMTEVISSNALGPDILLCGDVERNVGPHYIRSTDVLSYSHEDLRGMQIFREEKI
jgi:hypothetical protein